jgi:hypothetical protein
MFDTDDITEIHEDDTAFIHVPRPTRKTVRTVRRETSSPRSSLYDVTQGMDRYYVVADNEDKVFEVAAMRMVKDPDRCSWPPVISEVIK